tara:strand:- start:883 stop:1620 length:738 start_codon:yes stop_codon:yes gene_type:complete
MSLTEINLREKEFHNKLHSDGSKRSESIFYKALHNLYEDFFNFIKNKSQNKNVLDFGCGIGSYAERVLAFNPLKITGIDISEKAINIAKDKKINNKVDYRVENCESTKLNSNEYDLIYGAGILHHLNLNKSMEEINRLLKKNGTLIFIEPLGTNPMINLYRKFTPNSRSKDEHPFRFRDIKYFKNLFKNVEVKYYGFFTLLFLPFYKSPQNSKIFLLLSKIDRFFLKVPFFKFLAWSIIIKAEKN